VYAPQDVPLSATTSADGYALRCKHSFEDSGIEFIVLCNIASDPPGIYNVLTSETHPLSTHLPENSIFRINTGAPLPVGADAVIMVEDTRLVSTIEHSSTPLLLGEEKQVETLAQVPPGDNVRSPGSDVRKGELVMRHGDRISRGGGEVGTLAFIGRKEVGIFLRNF
jgi:gephyrin